MTKKEQNRLLASLNYICTYEKEIMLSGKLMNVVDVIEEFDVRNNNLILYGRQDEYVVNYTDVQFVIDGTRIEIAFIGVHEYKLMI